jgi:hypothetical protein
MKAKETTMNHTDLYRQGLALALMTGLAVLPAAAGTITAGFEDQTAPFKDTTFPTSNDTGEATAVDQWGGIAGAGWTTGWLSDSDAGIDREKRVSDIDGPFSGTGTISSSIRGSAARRAANSGGPTTGTMCRLTSPQPTASSTVLMTPMRS